MRMSGCLASSSAGILASSGLNVVPAVANWRNFGGQQRDHEAARAEGVEGVDLVFDVGAGVAVGLAAVVEAAGEEEHGGGGIEFGDVAGLGEGDEVVDLVLHADGEHLAGGVAAACACAGAGSADGEVEALALGVGVAVVGEGDAEALGEVGDGGGAVGVEVAGAGVGVAVAEDVELVCRGGGWGRVVWAGTVEVRSRRVRMSRVISTQEENNLMATSPKPCGFVSGRLWGTRYRAILDGMRVAVGGTVFLAAFLLFLVEPMAAKQLLPVLGGSSAVWVTCLVFFQAALLLGYVYAWWMTRLGHRRRRGLHVALLAVAVACCCCR